MNTMHSTRRRKRAGERGAALIIAVAIMTVLLAVALTFYGVSRAEVDNATNVRNTVQADLLVDGVLAQVMSELNRDFLKHPNATSTDFKPFVLYNGAWAAGKQWALRNGVPLQAGGVPLVDLSPVTMPEVGFTRPDGTVFYSERLFGGPLSRDWLYYPRIEGSTPYLYAENAVDLGGPPSVLPASNFFLADRDRPPFVTPAFFGAGDLNANFIPDIYDGFSQVPQLYPLEWIHTWTDIDNDGDGLRDSIWIPIAQDKFFSGGEVINEFTGARMFDDGIDNNLNGLVDESPERGDGPTELGIFVYHGLGPDRVSGDGLDNDGNGLVDDPAEDKYFLTAPLPGITIPIDLNGDGVVPDLVPDINGNLVPLTITLPDQITVPVLGEPGGTVTLTAADVDRIDNDLDMLINDYHVYAYVIPAAGDLQGFRDSGVKDATPFNAGNSIIEANIATSNGSDAVARLKEYTRINKDLLGSPSPANLDVQVFPASGAYGPGLGTTVNYRGLNIGTRIIITHSGEPVCDLAGRAAVLVRDEAGKVNVNVAGGHNYDPLLDGVVRSLGRGATTAEIETRNLPDLGVATARHLWALRTGTPKDVPTQPGYEADIALPGYGRVDDNANALFTALNGIDDDGDGLIDEGLYLPPLSPRAEAYLAGDPMSAADAGLARLELAETRYAEYYAQLGAFEGIDEPGELQRYRPLRNLVAEDANPYNISGFVDGIDNDGDGSINEVGELGDLQLQDTLQVDRAVQIGAGTRDLLQPYISAYSADRNVNYVAASSGIRALNKLDYNFATTQQIAANLVLSNGYEAVTARPVVADPTIPEQLAANRFADGLRQADVHIRSNTSGLMWYTGASGPTASVPEFPADPVLRAMQAAVDIVDNRDRDHSRSVLSTERQRRLPQQAGAPFVYDPFPQNQGIRSRIPEGELFPLGELQDHLRTTMDLSRTLEIIDDWWMFEAGVAGEFGNPEERRISYTVSGNEAVRINEIMVRAVRRVEAEAVTGPLPAADPMNGEPFLVNFNPNPFTRTGGPAILPQFNVVREAGAAWTLTNGGYLGDRSYFTATNSTDIIEFTLNATDGLPPGRYYLKVNTVAMNGESVIPTTELPPPYDGLGFPLLQSAVKYRHRTAGGQPQQSIIQDFADGINHFQNITDPHIGGAVPGAPRGWAFVDGTRGGAGNGDLYHLDGLPDDPPPVPGPVVFPSTQPIAGVETFTITVPPAGSSYELRVAFRMNPALVAALNAGGDTYTVAINALDFSQEPDHEWLELVNVSDEIVNIGGWEMEVGIPDRPQVPRDPFKSTWKVPQNTEIAPRGKVLLAFSKFDFFRDGVANHRIADNGMGLADGTPLPFTGGVLTNGLVTVPPIADTSPLIPPASPLYNALFDLTGSVFQRFTNPNTGALTDYVDHDGDGRTALYADSSLDNLPNDSVVASSKDFESFFTSAEGNLPWDRIIQLEEDSILTSQNPYSATPIPIRLSDVDDVDDVAALVLRGGVFPNYPEQDGIDNDGDGGYMTAAGIYIPGVLDLDMVDNNLDGLIDERGVDGVFQSVRNSEGVDEGRLLLNTDVPTDTHWVPGGTPWRFFGPGSYEPVTMPYLFMTDRQQYADPAYQVAFDGGNGVGISVLSGVSVQSFGDAAASPLSPTFLSVNAPYIGSTANDPVEWRAFAERRWNPGDNVIVTLYEGAATAGKVVDRVTYREYDVINRTIDDLAFNLIDTNDDGTPDTPLTVNAAYPTIWPPNQMGVDFYRSLERKHPLYNGDRFGTENRWQATDGNYDDWADSLSYFEAELFSPPGGPPLQINDNAVVDLRPRFVQHPDFPNTNLAVLQRNQRLFGHAMSGTPLRMNTATRMMENPPDIELLLAGAADPRQFPDPFDHFRTREDGTFASNPTPSQADQRWNLSRAQVANRSYESPADLMRVPHQIYLHDAVNTSGGSAFVRDMTMLNLNLQGLTGTADGLSITQPIALRGATLGQESLDGAVSGNILASAVNSLALGSKVLTMGQAEFRPIRPDFSTVNANNDLMNWVDNPGSSFPDDLLAPGTWAPVFLFELPTDGPRANLDHFSNYPSYVDGSPSPGDFNLHYLFNAAYLNNTGNFNGVNIGDNDFTDRWPLEKRVAMFVSENRGTAQAPEGLFIWDGEDGLENGEYILYVGTFLPQMRERIEQAAKHAANVVTVATNTAVPVRAKANAALINPGAAGLELDNGQIVPVDPVAKSIITRDPTNPRASLAGQLFEPIYALDVITDPSEARGQSDPTSASRTKPGGLIHPDEWTPTTRYQAGPDGYIFYGNNAVGGWKPQIVRVTDNFLALRVRNLGAPGQVGALTHIVLAPRKRTAGRINVNTADTRLREVTRQRNGDPTRVDELYNSLLGLPGVVDVGKTVQPGNAPNVLAGDIPPLANIVLRASNDIPVVDPALGRRPWAPPGGPPYSPAIHFYDGTTPPLRNRYNEIPGVDTDLLVPAPVPIPLDPRDMINDAADPDEHQIGAFRMAAMMQAGRTEHADGRYYRSTGDLLRNENAFDFNYIYGRADVPNLTGVVTDGVEDLAVYPLSNEANPAKRFDEVRARFARLGNLVTTRSDVYKIIMTVEAGYGVDRNNDGFINYRDPNEFVTTARTKASAVYERRSPSDLSGGLD
ncbi:MAG: hypothetical protein KF886_23125 [Candidatus Hydrogenedentes bacterium]|nr:hypothetical protein [Candidatus Hydrogenedentota bacterium]